MQKNSKRFTVVFAISMAIIMAVTLFLPAIAPEQPLPQLEPTATPPPPTLPPPMTDFSGIHFEEPYLHPSGLFSIEVPTGWDISSPVHTALVSRVVLNNPTALSVIEVSVDEPAEPVSTLEELSARYTTAVLASSWRTYGGWEELSRRVEDDRLFIDFALTQNQQSYLARDKIWIDGDWTYTVRVVVPSNARDLLFHMVDIMPDHFYPYAHFAGTPVGWNGYFDPINRHAIRYPETWTLADAAPGRPASFLSGDGVQMRVEARDGAVSDEAQAVALVEGLRSGIEVGEVAAVERPGGEGFSVSYVYTDPDGERRSGFAVVLTGDDGRLHLADALLPALLPAGEGEDAENDENGESGGMMFAYISQVLGTFSLLDLDLTGPEPEEAAPPAEVTPELTPEVEETPEAADEREAESTPETDDE
jgi:hypothetical protein